jgi:signal transduction histidine kinase
VPETIPATGNAVLIYGIFRNLTDNAIFYAGEGSTVRIEATDLGKEWRFVFEDNGPGVPKEELPHLFERFYRLDKGRSRRLGGTGLGLAIVKNSVLVHGGKISVRNASPSGLRFEFTLKK